MGCVLSIFGIATKAYYLGLFSQNLGFLTIVMAGLGAGFMGALGPTVQCNRVSRSSQQRFATPREPYESRGSHTFCEGLGVKYPAFVVNLRIWPSDY